jgi:hypothetical protein
VRAIALLAFASVAHAAPDYAPGSTEWNGLAKLWDEARQAGCEIKAGDELDWSSLDGHDVLWFVYPRGTVDAARLRRFLQAGGRALIADDFGAAAQALEGLGLRRGAPPGASAPLERYHENPNLPLARSSLSTALGRSAESLVANHPASFSSALPPTFEFRRGAALVVEGRVGKGSFVALADPSVLINNMLEIDGNRAFARALYSETCRPGVDRILLFTQTFAAHGDPPSQLDDAAAGTPFERFNGGLGRLNASIHAQLSTPPVPFALAAVAAVIALVAFAGGFPERRPIADRWTRASVPAGEGQLVDGWSVPWDYGAPVAVLLTETLERLQARVGAIDFQDTGPQSLERRVTEKCSPAAGRAAAELWRRLHRLRWRSSDGVTQPEGFVGRRDLDRLHALARALFSELEQN